LENLIYEENKYVIEELKPIVKEEKEFYKLISDKIKKCKNEMKELVDFFDKKENKDYVEIMRDEKNKIIDIECINEENYFIMFKLTDYHSLDDKIINLERLKKDFRKYVLSKIKSNKKIIKCPLYKCYGYLDNFNNCFICKTNYCDKCFSKKEDDHICDENELLSLKEINNDSQECPKCSTIISRISGCDTIYCIYCSASFSWKTGNLINILGNDEHNQTPKNNIFKQKIPEYKKILEKVPKYKYFQNFIEIIYVIYKTYEEKHIFKLKEEINENKTKELFFKYMKKEISIYSLKNKLFEIEMNKEKNKKILECFIEVQTEIENYLNLINEKNNGIAHDTHNNFEKREISSLYYLINKKTIKQSIAYDFEDFLQIFEIEIKILNKDYKIIESFFSIENGLYFNEDNYEKCENEIKEKITKEICKKFVTENKHKYSKKKNKLRNKIFNYLDFNIKETNSLVKKFDKIGKRLTKVYNIFNEKNKIFIKSDIFKGKNLFKNAVGLDKEIFIT
jgi:hypothetical protein